MKIKLYLFGLILTLATSARAPEPPPNPWIKWCIAAFYESYPEVVRVSELTPFEGGTHVPIFGLNRPFWQKVHYDYSPEAGTLTIAPPQEVCDTIDTMRRESDPEAPSFKPRSYHGDQDLEQIEYARMVAEGYFPVLLEGQKQSRSNREKERLEFRHHDRILHGPGFLIVPKEIAEKCQADLRAMLRIYDSLKDGPLKKNLLHHLRRHISSLDEASSTLTGYVISSRGPRDLDLHLTKFINGTQAFDIYLSNSVHAGELSPVARDRYLAILHEAPPESSINVRAHSDALFARFRGESTPK